jgi:hypothetical protein
VVSGPTSSGRRAIRRPLNCFAVQHDCEIVAAEFVIGTLLLACAPARAAVVAGGLMMIVLVFGSMAIEHFGVIAYQDTAVPISGTTLPLGATAWQGDRRDKHF